MSDTPRMNAARNETEMGAVGCQLERDLAAANATIADLKAIVCAPAGKIPQVYLRDAYETLEEFLDDMRVKLNETICAVNALKGAGK